MQTIYGPVSELELPPDRAVMVVGIPEGTNPPYIHSSGRIYRRIADESDPKPETDRHVLDLLWERGEKTRRRLKKFLTERPLLSQGESNGPVHAYLYLLADPHFVGHRFPLAFNDFARVMKAATLESGFAVLLPNCYTTSEGFIARQVDRSDPLIESLTFRWWPNGNVRVSIPVNTHDFVESKSSLDALQLVFLNAAQKHGYISGRVAEFSALLAVVTAVTAKYLSLRKILGISDHFFGKIRCYDTWRIIPFVNMQSYVNKVSARGFPVVQDQVLTCPPGVTSDTLVTLNETAYEDNQGRTLLTILPLVGDVLRAVGIDLVEFLEDDKDAFISELSEAMKDSFRSKPIR
jgi:hypothetical protein